MTLERQCPQCGADLPVSSVRGLCPKCLIAAAMAPPAAVDPEPAAVPESFKEEPHQRIGRYKLLQKIGEGGSGVVYMAEQEEPMRRRVALKVLKLGMDTRQVVARFEAERQALALMDHPNIAKVLDGGTTSTGRPYFVMELVRGIPITKFCDGQKLDLRRRIQLFIQVCQAIQHAHQKGIIHRDVKPSNILVADHDGVSVPKVIDFGIAKATAGQPLTEKTVFTAFEQFIGTPAYMSPEQAKLSGLDIDTRSDIYSLGVLLYELLTGKTPFDAKRLVQAGFEEISRIIREEDPLRPSTRLHHLEPEEQTTVARSRQSEPPKLIGVVSGDLDWIVMKTLEKDRSRRYETANGLAMDLQRFLASEPVVARPPSNIYRFQKLLRRHRVGFAAAAAVSLALILGLGLSTSLYLREGAALREASKAQREQERLRQQAQVEGNKSRQVAQFLEHVVSKVAPSVALGRDTSLLRTLLEEMRTSLTNSLAGQPEVQAELCLVIAKTYKELGEFPSALDMTRESLRLRRARYGNEDSSVTEALTVLGGILADQSQYAEAEAVDREALDITRRLRGGDHPDVAVLLNNLGLVLWARNNTEGAEQIHREALRIRRKVFGNVHADVAKSLNNLAMALWVRGDYDGAEANYREALGILKKVLPDEHPAIATLLNNIATILRDKDELVESEAMNREVVARRKKVLGDDHPDVAYARNNLAIVLQREDKLEEAQALHQNALAIQRKTLAPEHQYTAETLSAYAVLLAKKGDLAGSESMQREALGMCRKVFGNTNSDISDALDRLAILAGASGNALEAERMLQEASGITEAVEGSQNPDLIPMLCHLAWVRGNRGDRVSAQALQQDAQAMASRSGKYGLRIFTDALFDLSDELRLRNRFEECEAALKQAEGFMNRNPAANSVARRKLTFRFKQLYESWMQMHPSTAISAQAQAWAMRLQTLDSVDRQIPPRFAQPAGEK